MSAVTTLWSYRCDRCHDSDLSVDPDETLCGVCYRQLQAILHDEPFHDTTDEERGRR